MNLDQLKPEMRARLQREAASILREAARVLSNFGWVQGQLGHPNSKGVCAVGAIRTAANIGRYNPNSILITEWSHSAGTAISFFDQWLMGVDPTLGEGRSPTVIWNDTPGRTKEEVIQYMTKCADELDPGNET